MSMYRLFPLGIQWMKMGVDIPGCRCVRSLMIIDNGTFSPMGAHNTSKKTSRVS